MSLILKAAQSRSSSPAVADALGYSKLCRNLRLEPGVASTFSRTWAFSSAVICWRGLRLVSVSTFFQTVKIKRQLGHQIRQVRAFSLQSSGLLAGGIAGRVPTQTLLACLHELFGPRVEVIGFDAFTTAQFLDCDLAPKAIQDYVDLLFCSVFPASG